MELEVQRYLRGGKTLIDLQNEYGIKAGAGSTTDRVALNYDGLFSPMDQTICQECRSLILEVGTWNVAARSFFKFFNHGEPFAHAIDWSTARVQEKVDGTLITLYRYKGEWHAATRSTPDASGSCGSRRTLTFRRLVELTMQDMGQTFASFTGALSENVYYAFELTTPENVVIIPQTERQLTWLGAWDAATLQECVPDRTPPCPAAATFPLTTLDDILQAAAGMPDFAGEGYVVCDSQYRRVKIKSPSYLLADKVLGQMGTTRRKLEIVLSDRLDDLMPILPEWAKTEMVATQTRLREFVGEVHETFEQLRPLAANRRDFARAATAYRYAPVSSSSWTAMKSWTLCAGRAPIRWRSGWEAKAHPNNGQ